MYLRTGENQLYELCFPGTDCTPNDKSDPRMLQKDVADVVDIVICIYHMQTQLFQTYKLRPATYESQHARRGQDLRSENKQSCVSCVKPLRESDFLQNDICVSATYKHNCARTERMKPNTHASPAKSHSGIVLLPQTYICIPVTYKPNCARTNEYIRSETQQTCISAPAKIDCTSCVFLALYESGLEQMMILNKCATREI
jgi:hypothetical protein